VLKQVAIDKTEETTNLIFAKYTIEHHMFRGGHRVTRKQGMRFQIFAKIKTCLSSASLNFGWHCGSDQL